MKQSVVNLILRKLAEAAGISEEHVMTGELSAEEWHKINSVLRTMSVEDIQTDDIEEVVCDEVRGF